MAIILNGIFTALQALAGGRVYPLVAPEGTAAIGDYIVYTPAGGTPENTLANGVSATQLRLQVDCYSATISDAWSLNGSDLPQTGVNAALAGAFNATAVGAPQVIFEEDSRLYRVTQDFYLFY